MTVKEIYNLAIKLGIEADFRPRSEINELLGREKKKFAKMRPEEKKEYDKERLSNPYADTRILHIKKGQKEVKKILVGIDAREAELLLADRLGDIDLVISHHPAGKALAGLDEVMAMQADILSHYGVPINIAEGLLKKRIDEVARGVASANHNRPVDMARLLNISYMCIHTPCDNLVASFVKKKIEKAKPRYVEDVLDVLKSIPEYQEAIKTKAGPQLFAGSKENRCGRIALTEITGGTEGAPEIYERLAQAGIGTVIGMHMSEKHTKAAQKAHINAVIAGHISSDSLGVNLFLDQLEKRGIKIVPAAGLIRIKRK